MTTAPTILEKRLADMKQAREQAREEYTSLLKRALHPSRNDGATLQRLVETLGMPHDQVERDLAGARRVEDARAATITERELCQWHLLANERPTRGSFAEIEGEAKAAVNRRHHELQRLRQLQAEYPHLLPADTPLDGHPHFSSADAAQLAEELAEIDADYQTLDNIAAAVALSLPAVDRLATAGALAEAQHESWPMLYSLSKAKQIIEGQEPTSKFARCCSPSRN
jgi:hypothetical protein